MGGLLSISSAFNNVILNAWILMKFGTGVPCRIILAKLNLFYTFCNMDYHLTRRLKCIFENILINIDW
jgi:hypothetical protein